MMAEIEPERDLFAEIMPQLIYGGRSGAVTESDTSLERAEIEDEAGITQLRAEAVLEQLKLRKDGMTWFEVAALLKLHHGQASGCLSVLHKNGEVFALRTKRRRCHPYVHARYRELYSDGERLDTPVRTKTSVEREALDALLVAVDDLLQRQTWDTINSLRTARAVYGIKRLDDEC